MRKTKLFITSEMKTTSGYYFPQNNKHSGMVINNSSEFTITFPNFCTEKSPLLPWLEIN